MKKIFFTLFLFQIVSGTAVYADWSSEALAGTPPTCFSYNSYWRDDPNRSKYHLTVAIVTDAVNVVSVCRNIQVWASPITGIQAKFATNFGDNAWFKSTAWLGIGPPPRIDMTADLLGHIYCRAAAYQNGKKDGYAECWSPVIMRSLLIGQSKKESSSGGQPSSISAIGIKVITSKGHSTQWKDALTKQDLVLSPSDSCPTLKKLENTENVMQETLSLNSLQSSWSGIYNLWSADWNEHYFTPAVKAQGVAFDKMKAQPSYSSITLSYRCGMSNLWDDK